MAILIDTDALIQGESDPGYGQRHVITMSDGTIFAAQINDSNEIEIHKSTSDGLTWSLDHTISGLSNPASLNLAKSNIDSLFVGYLTGSPGSIITHIEKRTSGGAWSTVHNLDLGHGGSAPIPSFFIGVNRTSNRLYYVYGLGSDQFGNRDEFDTDYSDDEGATWPGGNFKVFSIGTSHNFMNISGVDTDPITGDIYVLWHMQYSTTNHRVQLDRWSSAGAWVSTIKSWTVDYRAAGLVIDSSGNRYVGLYKFTSTQAFQVEKNETLSLNDALGGDDYKRGMFDIAVDGSDDIYVFYVKESDAKAYFKKYDSVGASWGTETVLTSTEGLRVKSEQISLPSSDKLRIIFFST